MIRYDHMERLTAQEAMNHPYFREVRESELKIKATNTSTIPSNSSATTGGI